MPDKLMNERDKNQKLSRPGQTITNVGAGAADSGSDSVESSAIYPTDDTKEQRTQLRAAIKSAQEVRPPENINAPSLTEQLITQAQQLARKGDKDSKDHAIQLFSQAVALSPADSDAWMWLGGMLLDQNLERAHYCLQRAVEINPQNERARRGLNSISAKLQAVQTPVPSKLAEEQPQITQNETTALAVVPPDQQIESHISPENESSSDFRNSLPVQELAETQNSSDTSLVPVDREALALAELPPDRNTKIGLDEAVAVLREAGVETDPENVPNGGAKIREGLETGVYVVGKKGVREARLYGLRLTLTLLIIMALLASFGLYILVAQPNIKEVLSRPTPVSIATPLPDQRAAINLRASLSNYNHYFATFQSLTGQAINGKLKWSDFHKQFSELNSAIKTESQNVNAAANSITPQMLETFKELQDVAATANTASDYTMSGIENEQPEDLQAGIRFFNKATSLLADAASKLEQIAPQSTATTTETIVGTTTPYVTGETSLLTPTPISAITTTANQTVVSGTPAPITPH